MQLTLYYRNFSEVETGKMGEEGEEGEEGEVGAVEEEGEDGEVTHHCRKNKRDIMMIATGIYCCTRICTCIYTVESLNSGHICI